MGRMIIANRLSDGRVVFFGADHDWVADIDAGLLLDDGAEGESLLAVAKQHEMECRVVDPGLIDVEVRQGRRWPVAIREAIRAFGPSVRTDLGEPPPRAQS